MQKLLLLAAAATLLAACSSIDVATDHDPGADFGRLHSWAWLEPSPPRDPLRDDALLRKRIGAAIARDLAAKGYRRGAPADFVVDFETATRDRVDVTAWPTWCCRRLGFWGRDDVVVTQYTLGTLLVGVLDPAGRDLLWRGTATSVVDEESRSEARIDEAVKTLLADFPPGAGTK